MFITFEGIDGSGKTTQIKLLKEALKKRGLKVKVFREPGGTAVSEKIRALLLDEPFDIHPVAEMFLFTSARAQLTAEKIWPLIKQNTIVILDRFYDSTIAYQGYGRKLIDEQIIEEISEVATQSLSPDITFYLKIPLEEARRRTDNLSGDRMEKSGMEFYKRVLQGYDKLAEKHDRIKVLDSTQTVRDTHESILEILQPCLLKQ
ncbi:MAG TPA: dTMP kinase [Balneolaceae bacterium]|nr:dTMP kinase [Balneolaceae bacterium]